MNYTREWKVRSGFKVTCGEEQVWVANCYPFHEKHPRPRIIEAEANAQLIAAAVNACISVNPDNPQAVAEGIKEMYEALKLAISKLENEGRAYEKTIWICEKALAKVEGK